MRRLSFFFPLLLAATARAATLDVGDDKPYPTLEKALAAAKESDEIVVHPRANNKPYEKTALLVRTPKLHIRAADSKTLIKIDGTGFDYSGKGRVPRAIVQFNPEASGCTLEGFELTGAHNDSHNGAGVRINAANDVTIRRCTITANDMGIMSNGVLKEKTGNNQLIESCSIQKNGDLKDPGYNHNLYLGGTSVTVRGCDIAHSLTGHNLKSRAHHNWIEYNFIHDSANRELDLVDALGNTDAPASDTVLLGNIIRKAPSMKGNKTVIHFGKDGKADHTGTLWLVHNTITTSYISPFVDLSAPGADAIFINNSLHNQGKEDGDLLAARNGAKETPTLIEGTSLEGRVKKTVNFDNVRKDAPTVQWDKIDLPWKTFEKKPEALQQFVRVGKIETRKPSDAQAGAGSFKEP